MADGGIMGECFICNDLVWEDEYCWDFERNKVRHERCKPTDLLKLENEFLREKLKEFHIPIDEIMQKEFEDFCKERSGEDE